MFDFSPTLAYSELEHTQLGLFINPHIKSQTLSYATVNLLSIVLPLIVLWIRGKVLRSEIRVSRVAIQQPVCNALRLRQIMTRPQNHTWLSGCGCETINTPPDQYNIVFYVKLNNVLKNLIILIPNFTKYKFS